MFGGNSRVLMQFADDVLQVYYVLEIVNSARTRVDIGGPLVIDLPPGMSGATVLEGTSPTATISGNRITVTGPFAPGTTRGERRLPAAHRTARRSRWSQPWPAAFQQVTVGVQKIGAVTRRVAAVRRRARRHDAGRQGVRARQRAALAPGTPLTVTLTNLPYHSRTPRYVDARRWRRGVILFGVWLATRTGAAPDARSLSDRREQLLKELTQLELRRRDGAVSAERFATRRRRLVADLEQIYGELDATGAGPQGGGEGVAA